MTRDTAMMAAPYRLLTLTLLSEFFNPAAEWSLDTLDQIHRLLVNRGEIVE